jgi:SAM-dependent methyltransferase
MAIGLTCVLAPLGFRGQNTTNVTGRPTSLPRMGEGIDLGGFASVDASEDPGAYGAYLGRVGAIDAVREWKERSFALLEPVPGSRLLDLGCGTGEDVLALAARVAPGGRVIGIDASHAMIDEARRRAAGAGEAVELRVGDARRLDLPDGSLDGCRSERTLLHLDEPGRALAEMARVVRPGGVVVAAEPDWGTLAVDAPDRAAGRAVAAAAGDVFRSPHAGRALRRLLLEAGLERVDLVARTLIITDRATAEMLFDLRGAAAGAVRAGALAPEAASAWLEGLDRAESAGRFLAAMTAFMASGRRPGR